MISGTFTGAVTEGGEGDAPVTTSGAIAVADVDGDDNPSFANADAAGPYGSILVNAAGDSWTYTLDQASMQDLDAGDTVADTLTLTDSEGNTRDIAVTITGTDDAAVISGTFTGAVTEGGEGDAPVTTSGAIAVADVDGDDNPSFANADAAGLCGSILVNAAGDSWTYTLDQAAVQDLDAGDTVADTLTLTDSEGNTRDIAVTITGTNDAVRAEAQALATSENVPIAGTLVASDIEGGDLDFEIAADSPVGGAVTALDPNSAAFTFTPDTMCSTITVSTSTATR